MLYRFGILQDSLCSFCSLEEETPMHIFYSCNHTQILWERLKYYIQNNLDLPSLISQSAILGFTDSHSKNFIIISYSLLIFKYYIFKSRSNKQLLSNRFWSYLKILQPLILKKFIGNILSNLDSDTRKISNTWIISSAKTNLFLNELMFN